MLGAGMDSRPWRMKLPAGAPQLQLRLAALAAPCRAARVPASCARLCGSPTHAGSPTRLASSHATLCYCQTCAGSKWTAAM